jgi:Flp pilus assembly protein TadG
VVPLLLLLFVGIAEFGRAYDTQAALSQAARQGARTLALGASEAASRTAAQQAATDLGLTAPVITVPTTCTGTGARATVEVRQQQIFLTGLFGSAITLTGTGVMRCTG